MKKFNVIIYDEQPVVTAGIRSVIEKISSINVRAQFNCESAVLKFLENFGADIIITGLNIGIINEREKNISFLKSLPVYCKDIKTLVLTSTLNSVVISHLFEIGVMGVVFKQESVEHIIDAINSVVDNKKYFSCDSRTKLCKASDSPSNVMSLIEKISPKEREVLKHYIAGESIATIAAKLHRSAKTISLQKNSAMSKLNLSSNQELISFCIVNELFI